MGKIVERLEFVAEHISNKELMKDRLRYAGEAIESEFKAQADHNKIRFQEIQVEINALKKRIPDYTKWHDVDKFYPPDTLEKEEDRTEVGRTGQPEDLVDVPTDKDGKFKYIYYACAGEECQKAVEPFGFVLACNVPQDTIKSWCPVCHKYLIFKGDLKKTLPTDKDEPFQVGDTIAFRLNGDIRIVLEVKPNNLMKLMNVPGGDIRRTPGHSDNYTLVYRPKHES